MSNLLSSFFQSYAKARKSQNVLETQNEVQGRFTRVSALVFVYDIV